MRVHLTRLLVAVVIVAALVGVVGATSSESESTVPSDASTSTTQATTTTTLINGKGYTAEELAKIKGWLEAVERHKIKQWVEAVKRHQIQQWIAAVERENARKWFAWALAKERAAAAAAASGGVLVEGIVVCNGRDLPTCGIVKRESGFNPRAENPTSTASGLYQFIDGTWRACRTGYGHASYAPVSVQVKCARQIWDNGRGASHWRLTL